MEIAEFLRLLTALFEYLIASTEDIDESGKECPVDLKVTHIYEVCASKIRDTFKKQMELAQSGKKDQQTKEPKYASKAEELEGGVGSTENNENTKDDPLSCVIRKLTPTTNKDLFKSAGVSVHEHGKLNQENEEELFKTFKLTVTECGAVAWYLIKAWATVVQQVTWDKVDEEKEKDVKKYETLQLKDIPYLSAWV
jgi:hypothetical protein